MIGFFVGLIVGGLVGFVFAAFMIGARRCSHGDLGAGG